MNVYFWDDCTIQLSDMHFEETEGLAWPSMKTAALILK